jgi:predicted RNase H-like nuclease
MKLVNPPVALMFHEGARRLLAAGVHIPALLKLDDSRVALEAYPGLLARKQLGMRESYKSDTRSEHTPARKRARRNVVRALTAGQPLGIRLEAPVAIERRAVEDGSGDTLDALICAVQAAWGWRRRKSNYGLPETAPPGEGWIVTSLS